MAKLPRLRRENVPACELEARFLQTIETTRYKSV